MAHAGQRKHFPQRNEDTMQKLQGGDDSTIPKLMGSQRQWGQCSGAKQPQETVSVP